MSDPNNIVRRHQEHAKHPPVLRDAIEQLFAIADALEVATTPLIQHRLKKVQCAYLLEALKEMNQGVIGCLENGLFSVVEALSRITMEYAVNLMYVLEGDKDFRAKSLLGFYIDKSGRRAKDWKECAEKKKLSSAIKAATYRLGAVEALKKKHKSWLDRKVVPEWLGIKGRFSKVDLEYEYYTLFATASDSVHTLSEDIFNCTQLEELPDDLRQAGIHGVRVEKMSFAVYLAAQAMCFYGEAIRRLAKVLQNEEVESKVEEIGKKLQSVIFEHESLNAEAIEANARRYA